MPTDASMLFESRDRDRTRDLDVDTNSEVQMAAEQTAERRDLADVTSQLAALNEMTVGQLAERYRELYGVPTRSRNKAYLRKRVAWQIQANVHGGLSQRALDRIEELAPLAPIRWRQPVGQVEVAPMPKKAISGRDPRLPAPGTTITRTYKGEEHQVMVHEADFGYDGKRYRSLSGLARQITGSAWNGFLFFGLQPRHQGAK